MRARVTGLFQDLGHGEVFSLAERLGLLDAYRISLATLISHIVSEVSFALADVLGRGGGGGGGGGGWNTT